MDESVAVGERDERLNPPSKLFERLRQISGYTWDDAQEPFHSSYDTWQVSGEVLPPPSQAVQSSFSFASSSLEETQRTIESQLERQNDRSRVGSKANRTKVVAKISRHALREERAYHICKNLIKSVDPEGRHIVRPLDILRLSSLQSDNGPIIVCIFEDPGENYMGKIVDYGPAWYKSRRINNKHEAIQEDFAPLEIVTLETFIEFAIGATECLEILHHGPRIVHGEIRGDAFHMDKSTGRVRFISFGSGLRTFEHGLTSTGWSTLSKEVGAKTKLSYMSPEQTGRMPAEPDSRTDIYSLGILFWIMLTQQEPFYGETPMDVITGVLGRRLPPVASIRMDVPNALSRVIQKMTAKTINDRYHSASGLKHDLVEIQKFLRDGNSSALQDWKIASKDISSFFVLPNLMVGRESERDEVVKLITKVSKQHSPGTNSDSHPTNTNSGSTLSDSHLENFNAALGGHNYQTTSSEGDYSSADLTSNSLSRSNVSNSVVDGQIQPSSPKRTHSVSLSNNGTSETRESARSNSTNMPQIWEKNASLDPRSSHNMSGPKSAQRSSSDSVGSMNIRNTTKFQRKGRCEVVSISGAAGLGKSRLVHSVQLEARQRGYFASAKFDQAKKMPFGPVQKLLSSLFKQVFSETNTNTNFHQTLKAYVRPSWPLLHKLLALPEFLLGVAPSQGSSQPSGRKPHGKASRSDRMSHGALPTMMNSQLNLSGTQSSHEFLKAGLATKSARLMNTFLDVLRVFTHHKFICFCLDDLQFADQESLDLITQIIASKMKMVIIVTYRPDEMLSERIKEIIEPPNLDGLKYLKFGGVGITRITLQPLSEDDIVQYVSATLCKPPDQIIPLAAIIISKTGGNPFYMREFLNTCHRKECIWYDYRESGWRYNLDLIFKVFQTRSYHDTMNNEFIQARLGELPYASKEILVWASLIGTSFSFEIIQRLLTGEFDYSDSDESNESPKSHHPSRTLSQQETVEGLQAAIQAFIIVATQDDDRFRFVHDGYIKASASLRRGSESKMHFIIAQTLLKYASYAGSQVDIASHFCQAIDIIKARVRYRQPFRRLLFDCAQAAAENGTRLTAAQYYSACFELLQDSPWHGPLDVSYEETLQLHTRAAECYLFMGNIQEAKYLIKEVLDHARTPVDKSPAWVMQSRILALEGNALAAFQSLKQCLAALDIQIDENPTLEKCDSEFQRLSSKIRSCDKEKLVSRTMSKNSNLTAVGAVLLETTRNAYWSDTLRFYQMSLVMVNTQVNVGGFPQADIAYLYLGMIALSRFNMVDFASTMGDISHALQDKWHDEYTLRNGAMFSLFLGHIQTPLHECLSQLDGALEYSIQAGDRSSTILDFGLVVNLRFFASEALQEIEAFCTYGCEEIPNWQLDTRGGTMVIAVQQVARALQGKTAHWSSTEMMDDEQHCSLHYKTWLRNILQNSDRQLVFYEGIEICPVFLYGHYQGAVELGKANYERLETVWSARNARFLMFFYGLSLAALTWQNLDRPSGVNSQQSQNATSSRRSENGNHDFGAAITQISQLMHKIEDWQAVSDVNYLCWSKLLAAQLAEMKSDHGAALRLYEHALDHASANKYLLEEAIGNQLLAEMFLRLGSIRSAKAALREAVMLYRQLGAVGVATHLEVKHNLLLQGNARNAQTADASVQTNFAGDSVDVQYQTLENDESDSRQQTRAVITETKEQRIGAWQGASARPKAGASLSTLDMLDLTSILESSQVISSVLQVDELLKTMCEIILQNCGGLATSATIVVEEDEPVGWSIAASGDPENGAHAHIPGIPLRETAVVAEGVILYCTRFRETVFLPSLAHDERFSNVTVAWAQRNPNSKSIIAIPIEHGSKPLLGVLYLEGEPHAFTDRNLTVLQLLVNQIGISYSNALTMKDIKKVSAFNTSMVDMQKKALKKALDAEKQANAAKAEALRNVKLAEEAAKAKSIFLANIGHELRTPLNGVIGNSELLKDSELRRDQADMADSIRVSADLLLTVINDLLDLSRMEADKMKLWIVAFNPDEMIKEVIRSVSYQKKSTKNVQILQDIKLPQMLVFGDPIRLHQVLGNLVGNSLKFTEKGSITIGARTDLESKNSVKLTFWVKDTGIGIPEQHLANLFQPFSQADASTARKYGGSGLGLSICKSLIESLMGGQLRLESTENEGTTAWFSVTFPRADPDVSQGDARRDAPQLEMANAIDNPTDRRLDFKDFSNVPRKDLRICIAEDNPINQKIAVQFMNKLGFRVVDAYDNGLLAVEGLRKKAKEGVPYHIILMDVQMPVMDGYDATKLLREDPIESVRGILVIAMTASAIQGDREKCLASGMNDYLAKPVRSTVLKKTLDRYIQQPPLIIPDLSESAKEMTRNALHDGINDGDK